MGNWGYNKFIHSKVPINVFKNPNDDESGE